MSYFYTHIVGIEEILVDLDQMDLSEKEKKHLASLIDSSLHHTIIDAILDELPEKEREEFLKYHPRLDHEEIWKFLGTRAKSIEEKIKVVSDELKVKIKQDIKEAKSIKR